MPSVPLRVDFAGGWLDVPKHAIPGTYIVNCAISPLVDLAEWPYEQNSGLGGSAAFSIAQGRNGVEDELNLGVGWQDPAIIRETGLCVWRSGNRPILEAKVNPDFLMGKMALYWTGKPHRTPDLVDMPRDYGLIARASRTAYTGVLDKSLYDLYYAVDLTYVAQLHEGMDQLPEFGEQAKKYCGGGWGGYALYLFDDRPDGFLNIEPYLHD